MSSLLHDDDLVTRSLLQYVPTAYTKWADSDELPSNSPTLDRQHGQYKKVDWEDENEPGSGHEIPIPEGVRITIPGLSIGMQPPRLVRQTQ